jgi:hypothetical protein
MGYAKRAWDWRNRDRRECGDRKDDRHDRKDEDKGRRGRDCK